MTQELKLAARTLIRGRAASLVAVLSLAVGIAANSTIFSLVQALEFPTLIYPEPSGIVLLESRNHARGIQGMLLSIPDAIDVASSSRTLALATVVADQTSILRQASGNRRVGGRRVTAPFFDVLRVPAAMGRTLIAADRPGVIVLSDALWRSQFAADPSVVGRTVRLDGGIVEVVGVMPAHFDTDADFWVPLVTEAGAPRGDRRFSVFARLAPDSTIDDAARELTAISQRLAAAHAGTNTGWEIYPVEIARFHGRDSRQSFLLLQAAVGFVLLIACANIANILLARGATRRHEMGIRLSLGATRARLAWSLMTESVVLCALGGALGVLLATWGIQLARTIGGYPDVIQPRLNIWVLTFTAALSMLTALACGLLPALQASGVRPTTALQGEGRTLAGGARGRLRSALVAVQIAIAVILVTCGSLMLRTMMNRLRVDLGFDPRGAIRGDVSLPFERYPDPVARRTAVDRLLDAARRGAGVTAVGASTWALPTDAGGQRSITMPANDDRMLPASVRRGFDAITPGYLEAIALPLHAGHDFTAADGPGGAPVAIVNEELARHLFAGRNPIGESLRLGAREEAAPIVTIVGVVATARRSPMHDAAVARVYVPFAQHPNGMPAFVVRSSERPDAAMRAFEQAVRGVDPELLVENMRTVSDDVGRFVAPVRLVTSLLTGFAVIGLLLAALGVFGSMSYAIAQRRREMAVRSALGASRPDIVRLVLRGAVAVTIAGVLAGVFAASLASRAIAGMVFGVSVADPITFVTAGMLLAAVALAACYPPARAAASVDPMAVLRD
jgi:predicted permease